MATPFKKYFKSQPRSIKLTIQQLVRMRTDMVFNCPQNYQISRLIKLSPKKSLTSEPSCLILCLRKKTFVVTVKKL